MSDAARRDALAYLESHNVATLATTGPDGVWAAAVFYASEGFTLYFLSAPSTRHARNLAAEPRLAATIQEDYRDWSEIKGIQLEGRARPLDGAERELAVARFAAKFPVTGPQAPEPIRQALGKVAFFALEPVRLHFIDNSKGLGNRDEVPL